jgi:DNA-binding NtrC family response regulator
MRHILVVDDDPAISSLMQEALETDGSYRVTAFTTVQDALAVIERDRPDAALIDALMPEISGLILARRLLDVGIPVLLVSGHPGMEETLERAGCRFLEKPFRVGTLLAEMQALLDDAARRQADLAMRLDELNKE